MYYLCDCIAVVAIVAAIVNGFSNFYYRIQDGLKIPTTEEEAKDAANSATNGSGTTSSSSFIDVDKECEYILG